VFSRAFNKDKATLISALGKTLNMVALTACFDASGKEYDQRFIVVAGFVSSADRWITFDRVWNDRLKEDGLPYFHASALNRFSSPFNQGWKGNPSRINRLRENLADIAVAHSFAKFACVIENTRFKNIITKELREKAFPDRRFAILFSVARPVFWTVFRVTRERDRVHYLPHIVRRLKSASGFSGCHGDKKACSRAA
jgi:hypothetical protein